MIQQTEMFFSQLILIPENIYMTVPGSLVPRLFVDSDFRGYKSGYKAKFHVDYSIAYFDHITSFKALYL